MNRKFLYWWLLNCLTVALLFVLWDFGILRSVYTQDATYITFLLTVLLTGATASIGWKYYKHKLNTSYFVESYVSSIAITLGMVGTVIGFMIMLSGTFGNIELNDVQAVKRLLEALTTGLFTALNTTLVGLITSLHLRTQFVLLGSTDDQV